MRFLVDENIGQPVADWLVAQGHEVFSILAEAPGLDDTAILALAFTERWILITSDKDFGEHVHRLGRPHAGIILFRLIDERPSAKIVALRRVLTEHAERLAGAYLVVSEGNIRFGQQ